MIYECPVRRDALACPCEDRKSQGVVRTGALGLLERLHRFPDGDRGGDQPGPEIIPVDECRVEDVS